MLLQSVEQGFDWREGGILIPNVGASYLWDADTLHDEPGQGVWKVLVSLLSSQWAPSWSVLRIQHQFEERTLSEGGVMMR